MSEVPPELALLALDHVPDAIVVIDAFGIVWYTNQVVSTLFGYSQGEVVGESIDMLLPPRYRSPHVELRGGFFLSGPQRPADATVEVVGLRKDGEEFPAEIKLSSLGRAGLVSAAIRDIATRKRIEAELAVARAATEALLEATRAAARRPVPQGGFDLRQPLRTIALLNGVLRHMVTDSDAADALLQQEHAIASLLRLLDAGNAAG